MGGCFILHRLGSTTHRKGDAGKESDIRGMGFLGVTSGSFF